MIFITFSCLYISIFCDAAPAPAPPDDDVDVSFADYTGAYYKIAFGQYLGDETVSQGFQGIASTDTVVWNNLFAGVGGAGTRSQCQCFRQYAGVFN